MTRSQSIELQSDVKIHVVTSDPDDHAHPHSRPRDRPTLVFLHYWGGSTRTWSRVIPLVSSAYPTIAVDLRGWGESVGPADPAAYSVAHLADDVEEAVAGRLGLPGGSDVVLVGLSMGAKVAQVIAGRGRLDGRPGRPRLRGAVLVSPAPPSPLVLPPEAGEQQAHAYESWQGAELAARGVLLSSPQALGDELLKQVVGDMLRGSEHARAAWPSYAMGEDVVSLARRIRVPVLVVAAARDVVEPLDRVRREVCGNIQGSELVVVPSSGHLSPLEAPDEVAKHLLKFLGELRE